jgi:hypothetical protein
MGKYSTIQKVLVCKCVTFLGCAVTKYLVLKCVSGKYLCCENKECKHGGLHKTRGSDEKCAGILLGNMK